jgi:hypothetical protein
VTRLSMPVAICGGVAIALALEEPRAIPLIVAALVAIMLILLSGRGGGGPTAAGGAA